MAQSRIQKDVRRRVGIVVLVAAIAVPVLAVRLFVLTVVDGEGLADRAEQRLDTERLLPTWRGKLLDRKGRVIAEDVASYDAAVSYELAKGTWVRERAVEAARQAIGKAKWRALPAAARERAADDRMPEWQEAQARLFAALATRGGLSRSELEGKLHEIASRIDARAAAIHRQTLASRRERGLSVDIAPEPIREMREFHPVLRDLPTETANELRRLADACPGGIAIVDASRRSRAWETTEVEIPRDHLPRPVRASVPLVMQLADPLDALRGSIRRETWQEDLRRRPFERTLPDGTRAIDLGGYRAGTDSVGARGFERQFEDELRGTRGQVMRRLDTEEEVRVEPIPGRDVRLSIDAQLEVRVQAALDPRLGLTRVQSWQSHSDVLRIGDALPAAAVIIEVATGEVLAAASTPTPEVVAMPGPFVVGAATASLNRALDGAYPPGSIVKPLVYLAGVTEGAVGESEEIRCDGHFFKERTDVARCWIYRSQYKFATHSGRTGGPLAIEDAIARSCNIYFYTVASRLGAARLCNWYTRFGLGTMGGHVPTPEDAAGLDAHHDTFSTVALGIGQGSLTVTPLELASAYAMLARGGSVLSPSWRHVLVPHEAGAVGTAPTPRAPLSPTAVSRALEGLRRVVSEPYGTANHMDYGDGSRDPILDVPAVKLWAKTGTAEAAPLKIDRDGDGIAEGTGTDADHAWCVALVGDEYSTSPRYAVAVIVEHGGGGGRTSGPVMAAVIRALVSEGYLAPQSPLPIADAGAVR